MDDALCGRAGSAQATQLARHMYEKGKNAIPGSVKPATPALTEAFRTQPAPAETDEIHAFAQSKAPLAPIDLSRPLLQPDQIEYNPLAQTAAAQRFDVQTRSLLSSRPDELQEKRVPPSALARLKLVAGHINPDTNSTVPPLHQLHKQEQSSPRFAIFDHLLTPPDGAFDPNILPTYHSALEKMSVSDLETLLTDERLVNRHQSDAYELLSSIFAMAHYQLGVRGPAHERCQHFRDAWDTHVVIWRKADAGWQFIKHTLSAAEAHEMLEAILHLPNLPWHRAAFTCHHYAMRKDTRLSEKIQFFFLSAAFHQKDERISRQYQELKKLDQHAVQAYIKQRSEDPNVASLEKARFAQYLAA